MAYDVCFNKTRYTVLHKHLYKVLHKHRWKAYENIVGSFSKNVYFSPCSLNNKDSEPTEYLVD